MISAGSPIVGATRRSCSRAPSSFAGIHESYLAAGADVVETDTFTASRLKLDEYSLGEADPRDQPARGDDRARGLRRLFDAGSGRVSSPDRWGRPECWSLRRIPRSRT